MKTQDRLVRPLHASAAIAVASLHGATHLVEQLLFTFRNDAARIIEVLTWLGRAYIALAAALALRDRAQVLEMLRSAFRPASRCSGSA